MKVHQRLTRKHSIWSDSNISHILMKCVLWDHKNFSCMVYILNYKDTKNSVKCVFVDHTNLRAFLYLFLWTKTQNHQISLVWFISLILIRPRIMWNVLLQIRQISKCFHILILVNKTQKSRDLSSMVYILFSTRKTRNPDIYCTCINSVQYAISSRFYKLNVIQIWYCVTIIHSITR